MSEKMSIQDQIDAITPSVDEYLEKLQHVTNSEDQYDQILFDAQPGHELQRARSEYNVFRIAWRSFWIAGEELLNTWRNLKIQLKLERHEPLNQSETTQLENDQEAARIMADP